MALKNYGERIVNRQIKNTLAISTMEKIRQ